MIFKTPVDELRAYTRLLADLDGSPIYWLNLAEIYGEMAGRPVMLLARAQTCAILTAKWDGPHTMRTFYKEAGLYFGPEGDEPVSEFKNPVTGKIMAVKPAFREGPAIYTYTANADAVFGATELDPKTVKKMPWTWRTSGPNVWMTNEDAGIWGPGDPHAAGVQARDPLAGRILQTWHANAGDLANPQLTNAPSVKHYSMMSSAWLPLAGDPGALGAGFVRGMGAKLTPRGAATRPEILRLRNAHPDFFAETWNA